MLMKRLKNTPGYTQFEYVTEGLPHLLAASDFAVSRAGSNAIFELLALTETDAPHSTFCSKKQRRSDFKCIPFSNRSDLHMY